SATVRLNFPWQTLVFVSCSAFFSKIPSESPCFREFGAEPEIGGESRQQPVREAGLSHGASFIKALRSPLLYRCGMFVNRSRSRASGILRTGKAE
ncbi:MAG: hypothetical protein ACREHV_11450, partial [Rhizomicrobium sp.]